MKSEIIIILIFLVTIVVSEECSFKGLKLTNPDSKCKTECYANFQQASSRCNGIEGNGADSLTCTMLAEARYRGCIQDCPPADNGAVSYKKLCKIDSKIDLDSEHYCAIWWKAENLAGYKNRQKYFTKEKRSARCCTEFIQAAYYELSNRGEKLDKCDIGIDGDTVYGNAYIDNLCFGWGKCALCGVIDDVMMNGNPEAEKIGHNYDVSC